jgi:hypothetical protein
MPFNLDARRFFRAGRHYYVNEHTALVAPCGRVAPRERLELHVSAASTVQVIELIRDLILRLEEARGTVVFHAAAAAFDDANDRKVILLAAEKGCGKTTLLLHLLNRLTLRYFSGDKVFATTDERGLRLIPWRDWPHIAAGTARQFPPLARLMLDETGKDVERLPSSQKYLLDPDAFEERVANRFEVKAGRLALVLLPAYRAGQTEVRAVTEASEKERCFAGMIERTLNATYAKWQTFEIPEYTRADRQIREMAILVRSVPFARVEGDLSLSEGNLDCIRQLIAPGSGLG